MATSTQLNSLMKFLELLYNPQFAQMTGTFDPMSMVGSQGGDMPLARSYMNSANEDVARVFSGLVAGEYDPITAKQELADLNLGNLETGPLYSAVDKVVAEINQSGGSSGGGGSSKGKKDIYAEAGMPSPLASYSDIPELAPIGKVAGEKISQASKKKAMLDKAISSASGKNTSEVPSWISRSLENMSEQNLPAAIEDLKKQAGYQSRVADAYVQGNAARLDKSGMTPFNQNLLQRALLAKQLFGQ